MASGVYRVGKKAENAHSDSIWSVVWTPKTNVLLTGSSDETVKVWSPDSLDAPRLTIRDPEIRGLIEHNNHHLTKIFDLPTGERKTDGDAAAGDESKADGLGLGAEADSGLSSGSKIEAGAMESWTVAFAPAGDVIASGTHGGGVNLWDVASGAKKTTLESDSPFTMSVAYAPSGDLLASGGFDGSVHIFDVAAGKSIQKFSAHVKPVRGLAFSPDSSLLLATSDDSHVSVYETKGFQQVASLSGHQSWVLGAAFSPTGAQFATCGSDRRVKVWDLKTRECVHTFDSARDSVWSVAFSPDGRQLAAVGDDASLQLFDTIEK